MDGGRGALESALVGAAAARSMYWRGCSADDAALPILWSRPVVKDFSVLNVATETYLALRAIDAGVARLCERAGAAAGEGSTSAAARQAAAGPKAAQIIMMVDAGGLGLAQMNLGLMRALLTLVLTVYPERFAAIYVGPVNFVLGGFIRTVKGLMPAALRSKVFTVSDPRSDLVKRGLLQPSDVPGFWNGPADHAPAGDDAATVDFF